MIKEPSHRKLPSASFEAYLAKRQPPVPIDRLAHAIINQLTVLGLVGSRVLAQLPKGAERSRESEIFERSIDETTVLVQQLADYLQAQQARSERDTLRSPPQAGDVVRLLRKLPQQKR